MPVRIFSAFCGMANWPPTSPLLPGCSNFSTDSAPSLKRLKLTEMKEATSADPKMTMLSRRLDMVTADLRESVMKARMQPVSNVFSKMLRMVRDLAQSLDRRVRLQMEGQETELDKSLLEAIKDPLTHAVRNSLDHGIEPPSVREAAGKDPEGTLRLRAMQEGTMSSSRSPTTGPASPLTGCARKPLSAP